MPESEGYICVSKLAALESLIRRIDTAERVEVDTEGDSLHHYVEKVSLNQLLLGDKEKGLG